MSSATVFLARGSSALRPGEETTPDATSIAVHEAAHGVTGLVYRLDVHRASILADSESLGRVEFCAFNGQTDLSKVPHEVWLLTLLSGRAAQIRAAGLYGLPLAPGTDRVDVAFARSYVSSDQGVCNMWAPEVDEVIDRWRTEAAASVNVNWLWIRRVAEALRVRKVLVGAEILSLKPVKGGRL